jgi:hypothetical protein
MNKGKSIFAKSLLAIGGIIGSMGTGCGTASDDTCSTLAAAFANLNSKLKKCSSSFSAGFDEVACEANIDECTDDDMVLMNNYAGCLDKLNLCADADQEDVLSKVNACDKELSELSRTCGGAGEGPG